MKKTTFLD